MAGKKTGKGRIYRVHDPLVDASAAVHETKKLLAEGMAKRTPEELARLLGHADQRVRIASQFELVLRGDPIPLARATVATNPRLMRLHGIWALAQLARTKAGAADTIMPLGTSDDAEVRAQWAKFVGEAHLAGKTDLLVSLLGDKEPRVRLFAAQALGELKARVAVPELFAALKTNADRDPMLRHALVTAIAQCADASELSAKQSDASESVRLGVLLAMRHTGCRDVVNFLNDKSPRLRLEAVRAIHDAPIPGVLPALAAMDMAKLKLKPVVSPTPKKRQSSPMRELLRMPALQKNLRLQLHIRATRCSRAASSTRTTASAPSRRRNVSRPSLRTARLRKPCASMHSKHSRSGR